MAGMKNVDLVWFNAGGGHRAAAQALEQEILAQGRPWRVRKVNLTEVIDAQALFKRLTGFEPEDIYNKRLATGFTLGLGQELKLLQAMIRVAHGSLVQRLERHWAQTRPDMVVSLIPNFNRCLHDSLQAARPGVPFATVLTDMADFPPSFWIEPGLQQHVVCGTHHAAGQALAAGVPPSRVHQVAGMLLRPEFHFPPPMDRAAERLRAGLDAQSPAGLVMFGGTGSRVMKTIANDLQDVPLVLVCGRNAALAEQLRTLPARAPRVVLGYTHDIVRWMALADFFIGKPGPGSLSEAVQMQLPVIVTRNAWTMPQERWNTEWVQQHGLGLVLRRFSDLPQVLPDFLARLPDFKAHVQAISNSAVFEVPRVLQRVLDGQGAVAAREPDALLASRH